VGLLKVMEPIMNVNQVKRRIPQWQAFGIGYHGEDWQTSKERSAPRSSGRTGRNVTCDDSRSGPREELCVHARTPADRERRPTVDYVLKAKDRPPKLLTQ
jgi:hypothetical protein